MISSYCPTTNFSSFLPTVYAYKLRVLSLFAHPVFIKNLHKCEFTFDSQIFNAGNRKNRFVQITQNGLQVRQIVTG